MKDSVLPLDEGGLMEDNWIIAEFPEFSGPRATDTAHLQEIRTEQQI